MLLVAAKEKSSQRAKFEGFFLTAVVQVGVSFCCNACIWRQQGPLKHWYPTTLLHGITTLKTMILIIP